MPKVLWQKNSAILAHSEILGTFGNMGTNISVFVQKIEKRVGVGNDVICQIIFQFYQEFHDRFE